MPPFASAVRRSCAKFCNFRLCDPNGEQTTHPGLILLRDPNFAFLPVICTRRPLKLRRVIKAGVAHIKTSGAGNKPKHFEPINKLRLPGVPKFNSNYFIVKEILFPGLGRGNYGIGRSPTSLKQMMALHSRCVYIPISKYEVTDETGGNHVVKTRKVSDCVAFVVREAFIIVELQWSSRDDFDVALVEPDGTLIDFRNPESASGGGLPHDSPRARDCTGVVGREQIRYMIGKSNPQRGNYKVITTYTPCGRNTTGLQKIFYSLTVVIEGAVRNFVSGEVSPLNGTSLSTPLRNVSFVY